jgi:dipeptidyl aminopeptidase/acylaminoacyl peptidase
VIALPLLFAVTGCPQSPGGASNASSPWRPRAGLTAQQVVGAHRVLRSSIAPDGSLVAFVSDAPGLPQLFVATPGAAPVEESGWRKLAASTERVQAVHYSPDGRFVFFSRDVGGNEDWQLYRTTPSGAHVVDLTSDPKVRFEFGTVSRDGRVFAYSSNQRNGRDFDVFIRPTETHEARSVYDSGGSMTAAEFTPDGHKLVIRREKSSFDSELVLVDIESLQRAPLTPHDEREQVRNDHPRFSKDGKTLYLLSDQGHDYLGLSAIDFSSPPAQQPPLHFLIEEPHDMVMLEASHASDMIAVAVNVDGWVEVRLYDVSSPMTPKPGPKVDLPRGVASDMEFSEDGKSLVVAFSRASMPNEIFRVDTQTGQATRITKSDHAGIEEAQLVEPTLERFKSFDGVEIPVFLFKPQGMKPGERAPVIAYVHGGPESQFEPAYNPHVQYLVSHGYIVAAPNVRGSTGYGKKFAHLDDIEKREDSVHDLAELNQWLRKRDDVIADKIAVMGGSYGGYMTLAAITLYPDLWAAACEIVGISNFRTFLEQTKPYRRALRESEYGSLARDGALLDRISPIHKVDRIKSPLMVVHGSNDPRVPVNEAEQIVAAVKARGLKADYLRFDNEGHGVFRSENRIQFYERSAKFFDEVFAK